MSVADIIILSLIGIWAVVAVIWIFRKKGGCCGDCAKCGECCRKSRK